LTITSRPHGGHDRFALYAGGLEQTPNGLRNEARVHDFTLDDGVGRDFGCRDFTEFWFAAPVVDDHEFDDPGADIQTDRGFFAAKKAKKGHFRLFSRDKIGARANYNRPRPLSCQASNRLEPEATTVAPTAT
jgi:hypothetical protein